MWLSNNSQATLKNQYESKFNSPQLREAQWILMWKPFQYGGWKLLDLFQQNFHYCEYNGITQSISTKARDQHKAISGHIGWKFKNAPTISHQASMLNLSNKRRNQWSKHLKLKNKCQDSPPKIRDKLQLKLSFKL